MVLEHQCPRVPISVSAPLSYAFPLCHLTHPLGPKSQASNPQPCSSGMDHSPDLIHLPRLLLYLVTLQALPSQHVQNSSSFHQITPHYTLLTSVSGMPISGLLGQNVEILLLPELSLISHTLLIVPLPPYVLDPMSFLLPLPLLSHLLP